MQLNSAEKIPMYAFIIMFSIIIGLSIVFILKQRIKDRRSPRIVNQAAIIDKGINEHYIRRQRNAAPGMRTHKVKIYYVIFNIEGGEHVELRVNKLEYSELQKGDTGKLSFQGSKYVSFERN